MRIVNVPFVGLFGIREPALDEIQLVLTQSERSALERVSKLAASVRERMQDLVGYDLFCDSGADDALHQVEFGAHDLIEGKAYVLWQGPLPAKGG